MESPPQTMDNAGMDTDPPLAAYREDCHPPFRRRVYLPGFQTLNALSLPWRELRRHPENYPSWDVAKIASARTVVGMDVERADGGTERVYLKRSLVRDWMRRILSRFRQSKEWREFQLALAFRRRGIHTPEPVYYAEATSPQYPVMFFYATRALEPRWKNAKEFFKERRVFEKEWESLARFTRGLHEAGILHGDYRSDHLYLDAKEDPPEFEWALIDLDGSRAGNPPAPRERQRALTQLTESLLTSGIETAHLERFLEIYDPQREWKLTAEDIFNLARNKAEQ